MNTNKISRCRKSNLIGMFDEHIQKLLKKYLSCCTNFYSFHERDIVCDDKNEEKIFIHIFDRNKCLLTKITDNKYIKRKLVKIDQNTNLPIIFYIENKLNENGVTIMESLKDYSQKKAEHVRYTFSKEKIKQIFPKQNLYTLLFNMCHVHNILERAEQMNIEPDIMNKFVIYQEDKEIKAYFDEVDISEDYKKARFLKKVDNLDTFISKDIDDEIKYFFKAIEMQQNKDIEEESCLKYSKK